MLCNWTFFQMTAQEIDPLPNNQSPGSSRAVCDRCMMRRLETYAVTLDFLQDVAEKVDD
jgi:hypothetical protein